jgi:O-antigen ligase
MTVQALTRRLGVSEPGTAPPALWLLIASCAGLGVGVAATISVTAAIALAAATGLLVWVVPRPAVILTVLVTSVFVQVITVSGVTIGRICGPIALLGVVVAVLRGKATLRPAAPLGWTFAYTSWAVASGLWSVHLGSTMTQLGSLAIAISYMLAFATLLDNWRELNRVLYTVAIVALVVGIFGIASQGRAGTNTGDPNFFAMVEIVALPLVLVLAADARARSIRFGLYGIVLAIIASVFWSLSRGGLIALIAVVIGVIALPSHTFFRAASQKLIVVIVLIVAVVGAYAMTSQALSARVGAVFTPQGKTGSGRLNAWRAAYTSIRERPLEGLGFGSFEPSANQLMLRTPGVDLTNFRLRQNGLFAHSAYIETLAELGIPGLALFVGLLGSTAVAVRRAATAAGRAGAVSTKRLANALLMSLVGWAVASIFLSSETSRTIWIVIGMSLALPKLLEDEIERRADGRITRP